MQLFDATYQRNAGQCSFATGAIASAMQSAAAQFNRSVVIAGVTLLPGRYEFRVFAGDPSVTVVGRYEAISYPEAGQGYSWESRTKVIAAVHGGWVSLGFKPRRTEVKLSADHISEIDFRGKSLALRFAKK